ncbi:MAG: hypothetical protein V4598_07680 [Bdellovibrionota bacterium]
MKLILLSLFLLTNTMAEEVCAPVPEEVIAVLTTLSVPNCRQTPSITAGVRASNVSQQRQATNRDSRPLPNPVCDNCRADFQTRVSGAVDINVEKKRAFFDTTYKELEKAMSSILIDTVALRTTYSTNSTFPKSVAACNSRSIEQELTRCNSPFLNAFKDKNLSARLGNEAAALLSSNQTGIAGILERSQESRSCNISDELVQSLKPRMFEEMISPAIVQSIANVTATTPAELSANLRNALGENYDVISKHPILKEMMRDPRLFLQTFQTLRTQAPNRLKDAFRAAIYNPSMGNLIDSSNTAKCESTIKTFKDAMCSPQLKSGNFALGPFSNFDKFLDNGEVSDSDLTINEGQLKENLVMFEFCNAPQPAALSLQQVLSQMNNWIITDDRNSSLSDYAPTKYNRDFGDTKASICGYMPATTCPDSDGTQCALYKLYRRTLDTSTPEGRLAASPDRGMNNVIRSLIGDGAGVTTQSREVLVQAGILPQANGQLVERPVPPERQPEYLANVANGTVNPSAPTPTDGTQTNRRPGQQQRAQLQNPNPQGGQTAVQPVADNQLASADDTELQRFQDGLDDRLRRIEGQTPTPTPTPQVRRQVAARQDNSVRNRPQSGTIASGALPTTPTPVDTMIPDRTAPSPSPAGDARLAADNSRQTLAQRQANAARAEMALKNGGGGTVDGSRGPASAEGPTPTEASTVAITINGDIPANLEQVLRGTGSQGSDLRSLLGAKRPFTFQLNNSLFDVRITNGVYSVAYRSGDNSQRALASTLQTLFNNSIRSSERTPARDTTLEALQNTVRN